jgi:hypothetical protein
MKAATMALCLAAVNRMEQQNLLVTAREISWAILKVLRKAPEKARTTVTCSAVVT